MSLFQVYSEQRCVYSVDLIVTLEMGRLDARPVPGRQIIDVSEFSSV